MVYVMDTCSLLHCISLEIKGKCLLQLLLENQWQIKISKEILKEVKRQKDKYRVYNEKLDDWIYNRIEVDYDVCLSEPYRFFQLDAGENEAFEICYKESRSDFYYVAFISDDLKAKKEMELIMKRSQIGFWLTTCDLIFKLGLFLMVSFLINLKIYYCRKFEVKCKKIK